MCKLCEENETGEMASCQDCGLLICFDCPPASGDDVVRAAYITASGDVFCDRCGSRHDRAEEEADDSADFDFDFYDPYGELPDDLSPSTPAK